MTNMGGGLSPAMAALLKEPVPTSPDGVSSLGLGNVDCWDGEFTAERCCDLTLSVAGDKSCWKGSDFGYNDCCDVADKTRKARYMLRRGEKYFQAAYWLFYSKARKRHYKDALAIFKAARNFDPLGEELDFMIQCVRHSPYSSCLALPPPTSLVMKNRSVGRRVVQMHD